MGFFLKAHPWLALLLFLFFGLLFAWLYSALLEAGRAQGTLGKQLLKIRVTDLHGQRISFGTASLRFGLKLLSALPLLAGFWISAMHPRRQALHDLFAGTLVQRRSRPSAHPQEPDSTLLDSKPAPIIGLPIPTVVDRLVDLHASLIVLHWNGRIWPLHHRTTLGRDPASDLLIQDPKASWHHAQILHQGSGFFLHDLNSSNGTYLNGRILTAPLQLQPGDWIRIGDAGLEVRSSLDPPPRTACSTCGKQVSQDLRFCTHCGAKL